MNSFAISYTNKHRKSLKKQFPTVESFIAGFNIDPVIEALKTYALAEDTAFVWDPEEFIHSKDMIEGRTKALIARNMWDYSAYYQVFNPYWNAYDRALQLLKENRYAEFNLARNEN